MKEKIKTAIQFILNPRLLLCLFLAWIITNGWSYLVLGIGALLDIDWMKVVGGGYMTFLWLPISPEKLVTVAIAIGLLRLLFPGDQKTLAKLKGMHEKLKSKYLKKEKGKNRTNNKKREK